MTGSSCSVVGFGPMTISKHSSSSGVGPAQLYFNSFRDTGMESDMSSAETMPVLQLLSDMPSSGSGSPKQQAVQAQTSDYGGGHGHSPDLLGRALHGRVGSFKQPAVPTTQARKGQGYRRLWQMVSRVQRGERLSDTSGREDVTVSSLGRVTWRGLYSPAVQDAWLHAEGA
jgi:hypothetical protein